MPAEDEEAMGKHQLWPHAQGDSGRGGDSSPSISTGPGGDLTALKPDLVVDQVLTRRLVPASAGRGPTFRRLARCLGGLAPRWKLLLALFVLVTVLGVTASIAGPAYDLGCHARIASS